MICRRLNVKAVVVAASLVLTPAVASASVIDPVDNPTSVHYVVSIPDGIPGSTVSPASPEVIFAINPVGQVVKSTDTPANKFGSPLSIETSPFAASDGNTYTTSGFDTSKLGVFLKDIPAAGSTPAQQFLGISFLDNGLSKGGVIDFTLNKSNPGQPDPKLTLSPLSPTQNVSLLQLAALPATTSQSAASTTSAVTSTANSNSTSSSTTVPPPSIPAVPEPASLALWSTLTVAGLLRARLSFRRRAAA